MVPQKICLFGSPKYIGFLDDCKCKNCEQAFGMNFQTTNKIIKSLFSLIDGPLCGAQLSKIAKLIVGSFRISWVDRENFIIGMKHFIFCS